MKRTVIMAATIMLLATACKKEDTPIVEVSQEEAVEIMRMSIKSESAGVSDQVEEMVSLTEKSMMANPLCGSVSDTTIVKATSVNNSSLNYTFNINREIQCTNNVLSSFTFTYTASGSYNSPRIVSSGSVNGTLIISQLTPNYAEYLVDINYTRNGNHASNIGNQSAFSSSVTATSSNILIDKNTSQITSGTLNISISGTTNNGNNFSYSGVVSFTGNGQATITLSSGNVYYVSL